MAIDALIASAERMVTIAWEAAAAEHEAGLATADALAQAAADLEQRLKNALVAPLEDSQSGTIGFVRMMDAELRKPWVHAQRYQLVWSFAMNRRAQGIIRHLVAAVDVYGTETKTMAAAVLWLEDADRGPDDGRR
jgi:hypothetical protein